MFGINNNSDIRSIHSTSTLREPTSQNLSVSNGHLVDQCVNICRNNTRYLTSKEILCCNGHLYCDSCINTKSFVKPEFSYADILKIKKEPNKKSLLECIPATRVDMEEIRCHTNVNGYSSQYNNIVNILHENLVDNSINFHQNTQNKLDNLRSFVKSDGMESKVGSLSSSNTRIAKDVRNSTSLKFSKDLANELSATILPELKVHMWNEFQKNGSTLIDVLPHDHGDLILYENEGEFKLHRDKVPHEYANMYSYIMCLDSNLDERYFSDEGNTLVYNLPWQQGTIESTNNRIDINKIMAVPDSPININMIPHLYSETVIPSGFLIFNSRKKHASIGINNALTKDGKSKFKFILKLDFWVIHTDHIFTWDKTQIYGLSFIDVIEECASTYYEVEDDQGYSEKVDEDNSIIKNIVKECKCKLCNPQHQSILQLTNIMFPKLNQDVISYILEFVGTNTINNKFSNLVKKPRINYNASRYIKPSSYNEWDTFFQNNEMCNFYDDDDDCND